MNTIELDDVSLNEYDKIFPLIVGFLNCGGGTISFGRQKLEEWVREFVRELDRAITPKAPVFSHVVESGPEQGRLIVEVPAGHEPPYAYRNVVFAMKDGVCGPATVDQIREWVLSHANGLNRWENRPCLCEYLEDLVDRVAVNEAVRKVNAVGRLKLDPEASTEDLLTGFSCYRYGRLLNAGLVLFGRLPSRHAPQVVIRLTHFAGAQTDSRIIETKTYDGPLTISMDAAASYIRENAPQVTVFDEETANRTQQHVYPIDAVREALVNACAHRDYESVFGGVSVLLFSNRLEVWNSGRLPEGVGLKALNSGKGAPSVLVNPTIVEHLYARGYMERVGRGSSLIPRQSKLVGTTVRWQVDEQRGVCVTFRHSVINKMQASPDLKRIMDIIAEQPGLRKPQLVILAGCSRGALQYALDLLRKKGKIEFRGSHKTGGYWIV